MKHSDVEIAGLVEELKAAQQEAHTARAQGLLDAQPPLLRVLKVELLGQIRAVALHVQQLRHHLGEVMEKETDQPRLPASCEAGAPTMFEQVESIVTAKVRDEKIRPE